MKTIQELIAERSEKKKESRFNSDINKNTTQIASSIKEDLRFLSNEWQNLSDQQKADIRDSFESVMSKGVKVTNLSEAKPQIDINLRGMESLEVNSVNINGLSDAIKAVKSVADEMTAGLQSVIKTINAIQVNIPEHKAQEVTVKIPDKAVSVRVPDIRIPDVKIPEIKIPKIEIPDVKVVVSQPEKPTKVSYGYDEKGNLNEITEKYKTGTVRATKTFNSWEIKDDRRNN